MRSNRAHVDKEKALYQVLGLPKNALTCDISQARKALQKQYHPDKNNSKKIVTESNDSVSSTINHAFDILYDPTKRKAYDDYGSGDISQTDLDKYLKARQYLDTTHSVDSVIQLKMDRDQALTEAQQLKQKNAELLAAHDRSMAEIARLRAENEKLLARSSTPTQQPSYVDKASAATSRQEKAAPSGISNIYVTENKMGIEFVTKGDKEQFVMAFKRNTHNVERVGFYFNELSTTALISVCYDSDESFLKQSTQGDFLGERILNRFKKIYPGVEDTLVRYTYEKPHLDNPPTMFENYKNYNTNKTEQPLKRKVDGLYKVSIEDYYVQLIFTKNSQAVTFSVVNPFASYGLALAKSYLRFNILHLLVAKQELFDKFPQESDVGATILRIFKAEIDTDNVEFQDMGVNSYSFRRTNF